MPGQTSGDTCVGTEGLERREDATRGKQGKARTGPSLDGLQEPGNRTKDRASQGTGLTRAIIRHVRVVRKNVLHVLRPLDIVGGRAGRVLRRRGPHVGVA